MGHLELLVQFLPFPKEEKGIELGAPYVFPLAVVPRQLNSDWAKGKARSLLRYSG